MYSWQMCVSSAIIARASTRLFVPTNVIASIREVLEPPVQIQEANIQYPFLSKGTYRLEYYMTIHRYT